MAIKSYGPDLMVRPCLFPTHLVQDAIEQLGKSKDAKGSKEDKESVNEHKSRAEWPMIATAHYFLLFAFRPLSDPRPSPRSCRTCWSGPVEWM